LPGPAGVISAQTGSPVDKWWISIGELARFAGSSATDMRAGLPEKEMSGAVV
jgi:hypothetical protein